MPNALVILVDGVEELEAVATIDVLRRAGVETTTASPGGAWVTGRNGISLKADRDYAATVNEEYEALVLPGGPGVPKLNEIAGFHERLRAQHKAGRVVAAICAAPTVLAKAGLLSDRRAVCFPGCEEDMGTAILSRDEVQRDGTILTSRGAGTAVAFALALVGMLMGQGKAEEVAQSIVYGAPVPTG